MRAIRTLAASAAAALAVGLSVMTAPAGAADTAAVVSWCKSEGDVEVCLRHDREQYSARGPLGTIVQLVAADGRVIHETMSLVGGQEAVTRTSPDGRKACVRDGICVTPQD